MSSDISRQRFKPSDNFNSVLMQQGRVQLDADWNEWNEILDRRWRSETVDIIGRGVVPRQTPNGFAIAISGSSLTIGRGRIYVDGLQAENHGGGVLEFDPVLGESRGVDPISYYQQPFCPGPTPLPHSTVASAGTATSTLRKSGAKSAPSLIFTTPNSAPGPSPAPAGGPHLVYLDVWEREVTAVEEPGLREVALGGPDTTTRGQTVWQVRLLPNVGGTANCGTPDEKLPGWSDLTRPSAGRLTTAAVGVATVTDPCLIPPSGGYRGLENRTYRVEIHDGGAIGKATFKWSRDNASLATGVSAIIGDIKLTVDRAVWDSVRRFNVGDWVEITDDWREFSLAPGDVRRIASVKDETRTVELDNPLTPGSFPVNSQHLTTAERNTRIKRWDQGSLGPKVIGVPVSGTPLVLEDGVQVTFTVDPAGGKFRTGDYWIFAARTADASVEKLDAAPPRGVHHHYCRLALVTFPGTVMDCRVFWPALLRDEEGCDCTLCVTAEGHNTGAFTIHNAVSQLLTTGGTICLGPGIFNLLEKPVQLVGAFAIRIRGQGAATVVIQPRGAAAFIIDQAQWCTLEYLTIHSITDPSSQPAIRLSNSVGTTIDRMTVAPVASGNGPLAGVWLEGEFLLLTKICSNYFHAQFGVTSASKTTNGAFLLAEFWCENNRLECSDSGIQLLASSYYETVLARNLIYATNSAGISATGTALSELQIGGNTIAAQAGDGIVIGTGNVRVSENRVLNFGGHPQNGIRFVAGLIAHALPSIVVMGNRLEGLRGNGLAIETALVSALIEQNVFSAIDGSGIIMLLGSSAGSLRVLGNELVNIGVTSAPDPNSPEIAAIYLRAVTEGAVSNNTINAVGTNSPLAAMVAGVRVDSSGDVRISDNTITNIAPASSFQNPAAGILVNGPIANIEIADNRIRRHIKIQDDSSPWQAIRLLGIALVAPAPTGGSSSANRAISTAGKVNVVKNLAGVAVQLQRTGITNNSIQGYGQGPIVLATITGSCRFNDNQCVTSSAKATTVVDLNATSIIASANRVECVHSSKALDLKVADKSSYTVLGNIVGGPILVNGVALAAPWQPLNVIGT